MLINCILTLICSVSHLQLLMKNPTRRLGCVAANGGESAVTAHAFFRTIDWDKLNRREIQPPFKPQIVSHNPEINNRFTSLLLHVRFHEV